MFKVFEMTDFCIRSIALFIIIIIIIIIIVIIIIIWVCPTLEHASVKKGSYFLTHTELAINLMKAGVASRNIVMKTQYTLFWISFVQ